MQISNWLQSIRKLHINDIFVRTLMLDRSLAKRLVPKKRSPALLWCDVKMFFSICDYSPVCLLCHLEEKKDKQYETNFEQCNLNLTADQFLLYEEGASIGASVFVYDLIPFPFQPMRDLDRNSGDQSKHLLDCTSGFDCLHFENLAGVSLQALWYWNNFMMFLASSSKHLPHPDWKVNRKKNFYPVGAWILLGFSS